MRRLSNNFATEPFLNRRVPVAVAGGLVGLAVLATVGNLLLFVLRGGEYREHKAARAAQQERMEQLARQLREQKRLLEGREVHEYVAGARFAQTVLAKKRFSWNLLLDHLEAAKPFGVLFTEISPRKAAGTGGLDIRLQGLANSRQEMLALEENLLASPEFRSPQLVSEDKDPGGALTRFSLTVHYTRSPEGAP